MLDHFTLTSKRHRTHATKRKEGNGCRRKPGAEALAAALCRGVMPNLEVVFLGGNLIGSNHDNGAVTPGDSERCSSEV